MVATRLLLLRRAPAAAATRSLRSVLGLQQQHLLHPSVCTTIGARSFSLASGNGGKNDDNDDDLDASHGHGLNGGVNPFERLLQHSQQFRQQMADAEKSGGALVEELEEEADEEDEVEKEMTSEEVVDADDEDDSDDDDDDDDDDDEGANAAGQRFSRRSPPASAGTLGERDHRAARAARSVQRRILSAPEDELDYEHELSKVQYRAGKERKFQQLLHREQDKDRVCRNCGERGHVAKHCLLPMICSNCGGIGHRMRDCIFPDYVSEDKGFGSSAGSKKKQQKAQTVAEKQRMGERYDKFKEEFDSQIEEYLEGSIVEAAKRSKNKAKKLAFKQQEVSQDFDPVTR